MAPAAAVKGLVMTSVVPANAYSLFLAPVDAKSLRRRSIEDWVQDFCESVLEIPVSKHGTRIARECIKGMFPSAKQEPDEAK